MENFFQDASILVTGGTGSFGKAFIEKILQSYDPRRVAIFSRDELKQQEMKSKFNNDPRMRFFVGDIRDKSRLELALHGVDYVVHAAALKQVDTGEYNPMEFVKTNIMGSQNVIEASISAGVKKVVALSTDKASSPINLYGATKLTADKLFIAGNNYSQSFGTSYAVVRYGNVMGSRGSVIPHFRELARKGLPIPITDLSMTRFWITLDKAVNFVVDSFKAMNGGELYVPRIPSMKLVDLVEAIAPGSATYEIGIRPGEKMHEEMISADDSRRTTRQDSRYVVSPVHAEWGYIEPLGDPVEPGFTFRSDTNDLWLSVSELRKMFSGDE